MTPMFVNQYANDRINQRMSAAESDRQARAARDRRRRSKRQTDAAGQQARHREDTPLPRVPTLGWLQGLLAHLRQALRRNHPIPHGTLRQP